MVFILDREREIWDGKDQGMAGRAIAFESFAGVSPGIDGSA